MGEQTLGEVNKKLVGGIYWVDFSWWEDNKIFG